MRPLSTVLSLALLLLVAACAEPGGADEAARMAESHEGDTTDATPMTETSAPVDAREVAYATVDGEQVTGYLAVPEGTQDGAELPGVIVIHEWWGLNDNIRRMADRLAGEGYRALAVDLYGGRVAETPGQAQQIMGEVSGQSEQNRANLVAAYDFLTNAQNSPQVGAIGWCFGGGMVMQAAQALPTSLEAAVVYYGFVPTDAESLRPLEMPILGIFGENDGSIPMSTVNAFESTLEELGKDAEIVSYEGADHAFANPTGQNYQPEAAEDAWQRTTAFLAEHLK
jgi:carboxymethylenebutenolidase